MIDIFISGSCVSRDTLEFNDSKNYNLVSYHARSSFCVLSSQSIPEMNILKAIDNIESKFQKRMVKNDLTHSILFDLEDKCFDILLLDLIDERFHIAVIEKQYFATRSNEFLKTDIKPTSTINSHSDNFFELWCKGINLFINKLTQINCLGKLKVQKAYWSNILDTGEKIHNYSDEIILKENSKLEKMYKYLESKLDNSQFIEFPNEVLVIKSDHKWGISPFHYVDDYYEFLNKKIQA